MQSAWVQKQLGEAIIGVKIVMMIPLAERNVLSQVLDLWGRAKSGEEQVVEQRLCEDSKSSKRPKPAEHIYLADRLNKGSGKWLADESFWW